MEETGGRNWDHSWNPTCVNRGQICKCVMKRKVKEDLHSTLGIGHQKLSCCVTASLRSSLLVKHSK